MISPGLRRRRHRRRVLRLGISVAAASALGLLAVTALDPPAPRLVYNGSASAPLGFYRVRPVEPLRLGDLVLARTPESVRQLAAERGYLPITVPLVKRIAALSGDTVCAEGPAIRINGIAVAQRRAADAAGRPLPAWSGCRTLAADDIFLLMPNVPNAFDGRYFGPISVRAVIGRLVRP